MNPIEKYPRSSRKKLNGSVHIPRMFDQVNVLRDGALAEYIFPYPMDKRILKL